MVKKLVKFGVQIVQEEFDLESLKRAWREVENFGYDSAWLYDHFYPMSQKTSWSILESWTILPILAIETNHLRLGVLVTCNSYRHPAILAKIASTVDTISGGRLEFGIGAGWHKDEYGAYGIPFPKVRTRIKQLDEAVQLIRKIWTQEKASFQGEYYHIHELISYPKPIQEPHPPIWIGGKHPALLEIAAKYADYVNFVNCPVDEFSQRLNILRKYCLNIGRTYDNIGKTWHGLIFIADNKKEAERNAMKFKEASAITRTRDTSLRDYLKGIIYGTTEDCIEKIQKYVDTGVDYFIPVFRFEQEMKAHRKFIDEIASAFK